MSVISLENLIRNDRKKDKNFKTKFVVTKQAQYAPPDIMNLLEKQAYPIGIFNTRDDAINAAAFSCYAAREKSLYAFVSRKDTDAETIFTILYYDSRVQNVVEKTVTYTITEVADMTDWEFIDTPQCVGRCRAIKKENE